MGETVTPNPQPTASHRLEDVDRLRRLDCARVLTCLQIAERAKWAGMTCSQCTAYEADERPTLRNGSNWE